MGGVSPSVGSDKDYKNARAQIRTLSVARQKRLIDVDHTLGVEEACRVSGVAHPKHELQQLLFVVYPPCFLQVVVTSRLCVKE